MINNAAQPTSKRRRTRNTLQKRKKWPPTIAKIHQSELSILLNRIAPAISAPITSASVVKNLKPQVRVFDLCSNMEFRANNIFVCVKENFEIAEVRPEVARPEIAASDNLAKFSEIGTHHVVCR